MFYDMCEVKGTCAREMVTKAEVVELCNKGEIANAKIQMWEGKPIVRCSNKRLPLVKVDNNNRIIGEAKQAVRSHSNNIEETTATINSTVVGKVSNKLAKRNVKFAGYSDIEIHNKRVLEQSVNIDGVATVEQLVEFIGNDFGVKNIELYKKEIGKKVKLDRNISGIPTMELRNIKYAIATYLMNMKYDEIAETYMKYN